MLTSNQKLIMFMRRKQEKFIELGIKDKYFIRKDEKEILSWEEGKCDKIWRKIIQNVNDGLVGLTAEMCPFCIENKNNSCVGCLYIKHHETCRSLKSVFTKIKNKLYALGYTSIYGKPLDKDFYENMIDDINNMETFKK